MQAALKIQKYVIFRKIKNKVNKRLNGQNYSEKILTFNA